MLLYSYAVGTLPTTWGHHGRRGNEHTQMHSCACVSGSDRLAGDRMPDTPDDRRHARQSGSEGRDRAQARVHGRRVRHGRAVGHRDTQLRFRGAPRGGQDAAHRCQGRGLSAVRVCRSRQPGHPQLVLPELAGTLRRVPVDLPELPEHRQHPRELPRLEHGGARAARDHTRDGRGAPEPRCPGDTAREEPAGRGRAGCGFRPERLTLTGAGPGCLGRDADGQLPDRPRGSLHTVRLGSLPDGKDRDPGRALRLLRRVRGQGTAWRSAPAAPGPGQS